MHPFDEATAVAAQDAGVFTTELRAVDNGTSAPHGGILAAVIMRAMLLHTADWTQHPQSLLLQYPRAPVNGPAQITVSIDRVGRRASQLSATLSQEDRECVRALSTLTVAFGTRDDDWSAPMPAMAPFDTVAPAERRDWWPPFSRLLEYRILDGGSAFSGAPALTGGWVTPMPPRAIDAPLLAYLADAWFPSVFMRLPDRPLVPTLDLSVHFMAPLRTPLSPRPLAARFVTETARHGLYVEDGTVWDPDGEVLSHSRQSALRIHED